MKFILSIFILSLVVLSACAPSIPTTTPVDSQEGTYLESDFVHIADVKELKSFSSLDDYKAFANTASTNYYGGIRRGGDMMFAEMAVDSIAMPMAVKSVSDTSFGESLGNDFSETNNQVQGVDEADIIKTDGKYIYTVSGKTLFIVSAGEDAEVISRISLDGYVSGIFIYEDTLAIFGYEYDEATYDFIGFRPQSGMTYFDIYDMSDKENLELKEEYSFEGSYFNARLIENQVYFSVKSQPEYRDHYPLPIVYREGIDIEPMVKEMPVDRIMWHPGIYNYAQLVSVHSIDLEGKKDVESLSVAIDNAQTLYMSADNMFILGSEYISEWDIEQTIMKTLLQDDLTLEDTNLIALIKSADNRLLSQGEKEQKIMEVYYERMNAMSSKEQTSFQKEVDSELAKQLKEIEFFTYTTISKIRVDDEKITYVGSGKVPGRTVNQFSLDEFDNHLRIATTVDARWSRNSERTDSFTNVFVLNEDLEEVGALTNLAPTERIYSTRFIQDRLYMVTFRQVDPFFVIDLSEPEKPTVLGDLKIPGFSRYLHPYDENHIIGIGQEATDMGRTTGLKISIFNVEDVENPIEVAKFVTEEKYASSSALYEHKAFLFSKEKNLLVIPAYSYGWNDGDKYNGAFVFDISKDSIELRGLIDHSSGNSYFQQVERSLYIDDLLYTKSPQLLRVNALDTLEGVVDVDLKEKVGIPIF